MVGEWPTRRLDDLRDPTRIITYGIVKVGDFVDGGVPVVRGGDIRDGRVVFNEGKRVTKEVSDQFSRTILEGGELVMNLISEPGHVAIVPDDFKGFNVSRDVAVVPLRNDCDHRFVMYFLRSPAAINWLTARLQGSVTQKINLSTLREVPIPQPTLHIQREVAHSLGGLDDKIESNRRMNRALEAMAQAIFKAWFIEFEPIRAKTEGATSFPGMPQSIFEELPDQLTESELGVIPAGWPVTAVDQIAEYVNGRAFTKHANGQGRMIIRIAELNSGPGGATKFSDVETEPEYTAFPDDILFAWSGSLGVYRWHRDEAIINQHIFKVIPTDHPKWYVYYRLVEAMPFFQAIASTKATTMGHIKRGHLADATLAEPPMWLIEAAEEQIRPLYDLVHSNERQSFALTSTRDALLPKLITGEIREPGDEGANHGG